MSDSPRLAWVRAHAGALIELAAEFGATEVCLCGSVARGEDHDGSDLDFYVMSFSRAPNAGGWDDGHLRATNLVKAVRAFSPYPVDVFGDDLPGWPLGPDHERSMRTDAIALSDLATPVT